MSEELEELKVCPVMTCGSILIFPEVSPTLPCARHGLIMVPVSEQPLRKTIYRYFQAKLLGYKHATHKKRLAQRLPQTVSKQGRGQNAKATPLKTKPNGGKYL
jgi:hypothetical protein